MTDHVTFKTAGMLGEAAFVNQTINNANLRYREWIDLVPGRRWSYLTVRTGFLFGKNKTADKIIAALQAINTEWSYRLDSTQPRWVWRFRAYLTPEEHADLCRRFRAQEGS